MWQKFRTWRIIISENRRVRNYAERTKGKVLIEKSATELLQVPNRLRLALHYSGRGRLYWSVCFFLLSILCTERHSTTSRDPTGIIISTEEATQTLNAILSRTGCGLDGIPADVLGSLERVGVMHIADLVNRIFFGADDIPDGETSQGHSHRDARF
jgi:hypothetical protein